MPIPNKINKKKAIEMRINGATYREIADSQGVSQSSVYQAIHNLLPTETTKSYKDNKADILCRLQERLIQSVTDEDIKKSPLGSRVLAVAQLIDKERLERGQHTDYTMHDIRSLILAIRPNVDTK